MAVESAVSSDDYVVQTWDTDSGLPHSTVTSIAQTPDGYIWVGTLHGGLARFDGSRFVTFDPGNSPELKSIEIHKLLVDGRGTLWIGNVEGGLISYRDGHFHFEYGNNDTPRTWLADIVRERPGELDFSSVQGLIFRRTGRSGSNHWEVVVPPNVNDPPMTQEDADGVVWYQMSNHMIGQLRGSNSLTLTNPPGLKSGHVNVLSTDASGKIWLGTDKELACWEGGKFVNMTPTNGAPETAVLQLMPCPDGSFWVLADGRVRKFAGQAWGVEALVPANGNHNAESVAGFLSISPSRFADSTGGLWFWNAQNGMGHINSDGRTVWMRDAEGKLSSTVQCWFEDHEGNIWVGMADGGLARLRPRIFHVVWPSSGADAKSARSVCEDEKGVVWLGTGGKQVWRWETNLFAVFTPPGPEIFEETKVLPAGDGGLWLGSVRNGLMRLKNGVFERPFPEKDIGTVVRCLYRDASGALWIGSEFGLFRWDKGGLRSFGIQDGFTPAYVLSISGDKAGNIWLGTALGELRRFHNGKFETFRPEDSLTDESILRAAATADPLGQRSRGALSGGERFWALHCDDEGVVWIGTLGGGLLRFKDGRFTRFTTRENLPSEHVSQILEDHLGHIWLGTRSGIVRVNKRDLNDFSIDGKKSPNFVAYGKTDGLPALECSGGSQPDCWLGRDGRLWFTTVKGAVWVDPSMLRMNHLKPPVHLEEIWVDGKKYAMRNALAGQPSLTPSQMRIAAGQHYFEFKFTALSFTSPDKVRFKWRLEGVEKDWVDGGVRHSVSYSFIPPGDYRFQVQACNNDGVWNETGASVSFTVLPYFWQHWWFKVAVSLFLAGMLLMFYTIRVSRLRALERLRLRIARDLHDEVGANLGSVSLLAQIMERNPSSADAAQVHGIAVQTIDTLRDIIWFIDPKHDRLSDLVQRLQETSRVMLQAVDVKFSQMGDFQSADLPLAFQRNVLPLFKETLHNILKHSHATAVEISVRREGNEFQYTITDNGVGFDPTRQSAGNGLKNMRRRAAEIKGRVDIRSQPGSGATVTLSAPITQTRDWWG